MDSEKESNRSQEGDDAQHYSDAAASHAEPDIFVISSDEDEDGESEGHTVRPHEGDNSEDIERDDDVNDKEDELNLQNDFSDISGDSSAESEDADLSQDDVSEDDAPMEEEIDQDAMDVDDKSDLSEAQSHSSHSHGEGDKDYTGSPLEEPYPSNQFKLSHNLKNVAHAAIDPFFSQMTEHFQQTSNENTQSPSSPIAETQLNQKTVPSFVEPIQEVSNPEVISDQEIIHPDTIEVAKDIESEIEDPPLEVEENDKGEQIGEDEVEETEKHKVSQFASTTTNSVDEFSNLEQVASVQVDQTTTNIKIQEQSALTPQSVIVTEVKDITPVTETQFVPTSEASATQPETAASEQQEDNFSTGPVELSDVSSFLNVSMDLIGSLDQSILESLQSKVREFRSLRSEKVVLQVKLEQSSHISNKKVDLFKGQLAKAQANNKDLKEQIISLEKSKRELREKFETLETQLSSSNSIKFQNQQQFDELYSQKIKTLELLDKKNKEIEDLNSELLTLQDQTSQLRKTIIDLETSGQSTNSNFVHCNIKLESLQTQIELMNKNNDWLNNELSQMTSTFSVYRKEKSAELSKLHSQLDQTTNELESLQLAHGNLKEQFGLVSSKAESSMLKIKSLNDELATNKEEFFKEISQKDRLVQLLKSAHEDSITKIAQLEELLDASKSGVSDQTAQLRNEVNQYKLKLIDSETRIQDLEKKIDEMSSSVHEESNPSSNSTIFAFASKIPGTSLNQLHSEFSLMQKQLALERRAKERLEKQINTFVAELEQKAPLINATKERANHLEEQLTDLSFVLETSNREKDALQKQIDNFTKELQDSSITITTLNRQKVDLARQVQSLLCQISVRGDIDGPLTTAEKQALARIASGDFLEEESDTDKLISDRLVTFRNVVELQKKNQELLHVVRELGSKLENEERTSKSKLESLENQAILEAKDAIITLQEEIQSMESKLNSVTKERDMFRTMLSDKPSSLGGNLLTSDLSNHSMNGVHAALTEKYEKAKADAEQWEDQLKQLKVEYETTINLLNKQISDLSSERYQLTTSLAKTKSSMELGEERFSLLQDNLKYSKSEADEIRKRSQLLQENLSKQELRNQRITEELIESKSTIDSLRSEATNLKAEKQLWKSIEYRLNEENTQLISERSRLNTVLLNLQNLEKTREINANDSQKRLLDQTKALEAELFAVREKLSQSSSDLTTLLAKKDADSHIFQDRIDSLKSELSTAREQLIEKKASIKILQEKVISLSSKLQSTNSSLRSSSHTQSSSATESLSSDLSTDALKLTRELEDAKLELDQANASVAKFKSIAAATENALNSINETFNQFKESTSQKLAGLESDRSKAHETIESLNEQLNHVTDELSQAKINSSKEIQALNAKVKVLQNKALSSETLKQEYDAKVAALDTSYQEQVSIAQEAQKNYDSELQKHAQMSKAVSLLREEANSFKSQVQSLSAAAKNARDELESSRESWESQKMEMDEELRISKDRIDDLNTQNQLLYNQIELLSKSTSVGVHALSSSAVTDNTDELRELITLLRREKDISDAQLDIANSDLQRVRHQAQIATNELDTIKLELNKLRIQDAEREKLSKEHSSLLNEVEQLNLLRESNITLRNELQSSVKRITTLEAQLSESMAKVQPLEYELGKLNAELQSKTQEMSLLTEEKNRWKQRSQDILNKYDRIDPQEHSELKVQIEQMKAKFEEFNQSSESEAKKYQELSEKFERVKKEAQEKIFQKGRELKAVSSELAESQKALDDLKASSKAEIEKMSEQLKAIESSKNEVQSSAGSELAHLKVALSEKDSELTMLKKTMEVKVASLTAEIEELKKTQSADSVVPEIDQEILEVLAAKEEELFALSQGEKSAIAEVEELKKSVADKVNELKIFLEKKIIPAKKSTPVQDPNIVATAVAEANTASNAEINKLKSLIADKTNQLESVKQQETKLSKINSEITAKNNVLSKEIELLKQAENSKGGKGKQNMFKAKDLEIARHKEDLEKMKLSVDKKIEEALKLKDVEIAKQRADLNKIKHDLNIKLQESLKTKNDLMKEVELLKSKQKTPGPSTNTGALLPPVVEIKTDNTEWKTQLEKIKEQLSTDFQARYDAALELHKSKIRAPAEEKINRVTEIRVKKLEEEFESKIKEKIAALEKQYSSSKSSEPDFEELKKKAFDEGREATKKEVAMRSKLLQAKTDKLNKEKKELEEKLKTLQAELKDNDEKKQKANEITSVSSIETASKNDTTSTDVSTLPSLTIGQKRPAEDEDNKGSPEKKNKSE